MFLLICIDLKDNSIPSLQHLSHDNYHHRASDLITTVRDHAPGLELSAKHSQIISLTIFHTFKHKLQQTWVDCCACWLIFQHLQEAVILSGKRKWKINCTWCVCLGRLKAPHWYIFHFAHVPLSLQSSPSWIFCLTFTIYIFFTSHGCFGGLPLVWSLRLS